MGFTLSKDAAIIFTKNAKVAADKYCEALNDLIEEEKYDNNEKEIEKAKKAKEKAARTIQDKLQVAKFKKSKICTEQSADLAFICHKGDKIRSKDGFYRSIYWESDRACFFHMDDRNAVVYIDLVRLLKGNSIKDETKKDIAEKLKIMLNFSTGKIIKLTSEQLKDGK